MNAPAATATLSDKWASYRNLVVGSDWWDELGDTRDFWSQSSVADTAMHASNELVHQAAEIGLLRDLYRAVRD
jgi:hypothetical protein